MENEAEIIVRNNMSHTEFERRWQAVRKAMAEQKLDFLICQTCSDFVGGYVRWFTDLPATIYPVTIIFSRDGEITTILHGPRPPAPPNPPLWSVHGATKRISIPIVPSFAYTKLFDAEKVVEELTPHYPCRIGLVGIRFFSAPFYNYITAKLTKAEFVDATDMVDILRMLKSDEEIKLIGETCRAQDEAFEYALTRIWPGRRDYEVYADIMQKLYELGSSQANVMVGSAPPGRPAKHMLSLYTNRVIQASDQFAILIEANGRSGLYGEIFRTVCLGKIPSELQEQFEVTRQVQGAILDLLKPGMDFSSIWDVANRLLREAGYPEETRLFGHGQGYDSIERPSLDAGETVKIQASMNIAVHPAIMTERAYSQVCENYIVREAGQPECLSSVPQKIFML